MNIGLHACAYWPLAHQYYPLQLASTQSHIGKLSLKCGVRLIKRAFKLSLKCGVRLTIGAFKLSLKCGVRLTRGAFKLSLKCGVRLMRSLPKFCPKLGLSRDQSEVMSVVELFPINSPVNLTLVGLK